MVVPAFREGEQAGRAVDGLRSGLSALHQHGDLEIVVVDDGSDDETAECARRAGADKVISLDANRGKGAAVRAGMLAASGATVAYTDADLSYAPSQLMGLLERCEGGCDMVVGSRRHVDTTTLVRARRLREVSGRVFSWMTSLVLLGEYRDTQCGLKAFRADAARTLFERARLDGFAFDVELFHLAERHGLEVCEVPVSVANVQTSSVRVVVDAVRMVRDLARIAWWSRRGSYT